MDANQEMNNQDGHVGVKIAFAILLLAVITAAGVGLLVQHRMLDEFRRARADVERANQKLVAEHGELVSANDRLAGELRKLRDVGRACATERAAVEKERAMWVKERAALKAEADAARMAQARAENEVTGLKESMKDLSMQEKKIRAERDKIRAERDKIRAERDHLERELNEALQPVPEMKPSSAVMVPTPIPEEAVLPIAPAPPPDKRSPEERAAHEKEELKDLIGL